MPTEDDLVLAIKQCPPGETAGLLAEYYEIVDARIGGTSALLYACYMGRPDVAAAIGRNRRSIDVFEAAALGDTARLAAVLNDNAASVDAVAGDGFHPLGLACFFGQLEAVILLLARGADVAKPADNSSLVMPLHSAVAAGRADIAALLLDHGAPVDARQQGGFTALMSASVRGDDALVDLLLAHGAALDPIDDTGKSAADHAAQGGHTALAARLAAGPAGGDDAGEDDEAAHHLEDPEPLAQ